jgi:hypothetical protein
MNASGEFCGSNTFRLRLLPREDGKARKENRAISPDGVKREYYKKVQESRKHGLEHKKMQPTLSGR